ncbi:hypothetical protein [Actinacidiphila epipremni]|uniref:Secreted protein n=1 Tax=Actinacidiphila epipremni TaxID=2053013 RepID=A0ABX0ZQ40_9ACTN|nr:hypothetical protein [Actinacidiphila epipremni]NJP43919.1 hypothetical protein [Actinacidiphila epipremni]
MNFRRIWSAVGAGLVLAGSAVLGAAGTAQADFGSWDNFYGIGSNWHCSGTAGIDEEPGLLAQECIVVSGTNYQAVTVVRASQAGNYHIDTISILSGQAQYDAYCAGVIAAGTDKACFTPTKAGAAGHSVQGLAKGPQYSLLWSPSVTLG